jgi:hypothetical protein
MYLKKFFYSEKIIFFIIIILSIFFSISYSFDQIAIEGGLVIAGIIKYPDEFSIMEVFYKNSWSVINQITAILLKFNLSNIIISRIIIFISTYLYFLGIFFIIKNLTNKIYLSFILSFFILLFRKYLGHLDYPTMIFHELTWGMISGSVTTFVFGLLFNRQLFLAGFFTAILIGLHILVGLWIFFVIVTSLIICKIFYSNFYNKILIFKKLSIGFFLGSAPILFFFFYYFLNRIPAPEIDIDLYKIYLANWDWHLNVPGGVVLSYLTFSILLLIVIYFLQNQKLFFELQFALLVIFISIFFSGTLYIFYKLMPNIFPIFLLKVMPPRYFILHSVITYPILFSSIYIFVNSYFNKKKYSKNILNFIFLFLIFYYSATHYKYILLRIDNFKVNLENKINLEDQVFWQKVKNENIDGFILTTQETNEPTFRIAHKPILIRTTSMDVMRMLPYTTRKYKEIVEEVYYVSFFNPPKKYLSSIPDIYFKKTFESRSRAEWIRISQMHNISSVIVPKEWKLNLNLKFNNENFSYYIF